MSILSTTDSPDSSYCRHKLSMDESILHEKFSSLTSKSRIIPIKLHKTQIQHTTQLKDKLAIHGCKYFSKISAVGIDTSPMLQILKNSKGIKAISTFEFDPYFCSTSYTGISELMKCFKNLKGLQDLQLTIRRVNETNETDILVPFFSRFHKIKSLYLELIAQHGIKESGHINIMKGVSKCHALKSLHCRFLNLEQPSLKFQKNTLRINRHLKRLEEFKLVHSVSKISKNEDTCTSSEQQHKKFHSNHLKKFSLSCSMGDQWLYIGFPRKGNYDCGLISGLTQYPNLREINLKFLHLKLEAKEITEAFDNLAQLENLQILRLEFIGCQFDNEQFIALLEGLLQLKQLKHLALHLIQRIFNITVSGIKKFTGTLANLSCYLKSFSGSLRKLILPEEVISQAIQEISKTEKMNCLWSNEILRIKSL